jgi:hypothetical protein
MNALIYKRTHKGDPSNSGIFGCRDCMGRVRCLPFDAVIGIGGKHPDRGHEDLAFKINWIGTNPRKIKVRSLKLRGPLLKFERFVLWDETGPDLKKQAPYLFTFMFEEQESPFRRHFMSQLLPIGMQEEVATILKLADNQKSTQSRITGKTPLTKCRS